MLKTEFYANLLLNVAFGIVLAYTLYRMGQRNNQETVPQKHIVLKILGVVCAIMSCLMLVTLLMALRNVDFPSEQLKPVLPTLSYDPDSGDIWGLIWGYPTPVQSNALLYSLLTFDWLGLFAYFFYFKSSKSRWFVKIAKFLLILFITMLYANSTKFHYFKPDELICPSLFLIICVFSLCASGNSSLNSTTNS